MLVSAFDSAGQRCSALRVLCLQEDIADRVIHMLKGAMAELRVGGQDRIETDVGPVIDAGVQASLRSYLEARKDRILFQTPLAASCAEGAFVPPTLLRIDALGELTHEVFGPILHVTRFESRHLPRLVDGINATGYGLTLGIHSRIDETIDFIVSRARAGNIYVNRTMVGAVVGVQPFGGEGLSGTGPKAGGPLYLRRLLRDAPRVELPGVRDEKKLEALATLAKWVRGGASRLLSEAESARLSQSLESGRAASPLAVEMRLPGPAGEDNTLRFLPRGTVLAFAASIPQALRQAGAALATGNRILLSANEAVKRLYEKIPDALRRQIHVIGEWRTADFDAVLACDDANACELAAAMAERPGPIVPVLSASPEYSLEMLVRERTVSVNTAAAGGNASLMTIGK